MSEDGWDFLRDMIARLAKGEPVVIEEKFNGRIRHRYTSILKDGVYQTTDETGKMVSSYKIEGDKIIFLTK